LITTQNTRPDIRSGCLARGGDLQTVSYQKDERRLGRGQQITHGLQNLIPSNREVQGGIKGRTPERSMGKKATKGRGGRRSCRTSPLLLFSSSDKNTPARREGTARSSEKGKFLNMQDNFNNMEPGEPQEGGSRKLRRPGSREQSSRSASFDVPNRGGRKDPSEIAHG